MLLYLYLGWSTPAGGKNTVLPNVTDLQCNELYHWISPDMVMTWLSALPCASRDVTSSLTEMSADPCFEPKY